jgi:hypothetical protein
LKTWKRYGMGYPRGRIRSNDDDGAAAAAPLQDVTKPCFFLHYGLISLYIF